MLESLSSVVPSRLVSSPLCAAFFVRWSWAESVLETVCTYNQGFFLCMLPYLLMPDSVVSLPSVVVSWCD